MQKIVIKDCLARSVRFFEKSDKEVPGELFEQKRKKPDLSGLLSALPSKKSEYTCFAKTKNALWMGAKNGLTRYEANAAHEADKVMYFSANRELPDNEVLSVYAPEEEKDSVWVLTETGVSYIELKKISAEKKAELLTDEGKKYVDRHGMMSQKDLKIPRDPSSAVPYGHSDNSGAFTASYAVGELCKYAYYKRTLGKDNEKTKAAFLSAVRATEACLLLCYVSCRGDGFVARTYLTKDEPVPDDGLFYRITDKKAVCLDLTKARQRGLSGKTIDASAEIPKRLAHLFEDEGYTVNDLIYKGDTSSDEITHHYMLFYFAHIILSEDDKELDLLVQDRAKAILEHILTHNNALCECDGLPTTWAKWNEEYFNTPIGWSDGCLNSAQLLMYHKVTMFVSGEKGKWEESYNDLAYNKGYAHLTTLHDMRFHLTAIYDGLEQVEGLMYGDNALATLAYWLLITLEEKEELKNLYREGYKGWNYTFRREHNPAYDIPYMLSVPDDNVNTELLADWFRRENISRVCSSVSINERKDVPKRTRLGGMEETSCLLMPDERGITKYDRNPYAYVRAFNRGGLKVLESCYVYTHAYWLGKYYGIIEDEAEE
ncbi:MAG: hypothetical protein J1E34_07720 [Oscillospiraceae bacterium]|nr:hypothetical protein [Oscillospiraceae bacterium]